jgi:hypothetical protein
VHVDVYENVPVHVLGRIRVRFLDHVHVRRHYHLSFCLFSSSAGEL